MAQSAGQSPQDMRDPRRGAVSLTLQTYFSLEVADFHPRNPQLRGFPERFTGHPSYSPGASLGPSLS